MKFNYTKSIMLNNLVVIAKCVKARKNRIIILSLYLFTIVFVVSIVYYYMAVEEPQFKDLSYIPLCFLVLTIPFIYLIIRIATQSKNVMFYDVVENKIYSKEGKLGILQRGYDVINISKVRRIYVVPKPKQTPSLLKIMERGIQEVPGLHFLMQSGAEYVSTDFDDYELVLSKLEELLPYEYEHIIG